RPPTDSSGARSRPVCRTAITSRCARGSSPATRLWSTGRSSSKRSRSKWRAPRSELSLEDRALFDFLIEYSLKSRGFVLLVLVATGGSGLSSLSRLPIDAVPDITNTQVIALTSAPALGPEEIEQFITIPVENAMNGIPWIKEVRSFSQFGMSGVTIIFEDG